MDPLSVAGSIVGILAAAAQVSANISTLVGRSRKAPKHIRKVKGEVDTIRSILHQPHALLLGSATTCRGRTSLILVDQVVVTLTACVSAFSELDVMVGTLVSDEKLGLIDRFRWATKAAAINESLKNLEVQKSTLTLMLIILTYASSYKAEDSVTNLVRLVETILAGHETLARRLSNTEMTLGPTAKTENPTQNDDTDLLTISAITRNQFGLMFEDELSGSGCISGQREEWTPHLPSLSNISNLAVLALPIHAEEISNREFYQFGKVDIGKGSKAFTVFASTKSPKYYAVETANLTDGDSSPILGAPLLSGMAIASVTTGSVGEGGKLFISGHIPTVARCCTYIKEEGQKTKEIFFRSGSATRIQDLKKIFSSNTDLCYYGSEIRWREYQVGDAASLLLRYLKRLLEPIIPLDCSMTFAAVYYEFTSAMEANEGRNWAQLDARKRLSILNTLNFALMTTLRLNRHLVLYLVDLLQACVEYSNLNLMTADRLVTVFQPSILTLRPEEMSIEEHQIAHQVLVFMIVLWEEGHLSDLVNVRGELPWRLQKPNKHVFTNP
ncbi:uncharacterized protein A1O5_08421 [Cladophialophora psammophila CBS 110553]|uniref:Rho-GAP domain-containing protein n=1 Tax=Cladophialophora psammophila CBS 110553 TaxID=1182543 RepID=W9WKD8_9EURO|nr:uncharacterized protein A1O5_08421 [Cladophialophora psammophila CBS 110553]EXJ68627.1 hypothetical protein A1O5_08421 [Cladophialophora psammophila CBS 110553]